jgi:nitrite reductase/ring-hydroxylating ferredoxin subunit/multimeric flavodoxin WrbA
MAEERWEEIGATAELARTPLLQLTIGRTKIALIHRDGAFRAISGVCNHVGGPLGEGRLEGDYVVCPWHHWKFHWESGLGEPGYEEDAVPVYATRVEDGRVYVDLNPRTPRTRKPHAPHPLARRPERHDGQPRVVGISTTAMDAANPRYSTSDALLEHSLAHAAESLGCETRLLRLNELKFRHCEGYYSKSAHACTWPCSITQMDPDDQLDSVYEAIVHWGDVFLVSTPIRWGCASSLYYKMIERMNCIQNQITIANRVLMNDKVAAFIITGGQDNVQAVAGQMLGFFSELGCHLPPFPFIAHSRGWSAEDMERNVQYVMKSGELRAGAADLVARAVELSKTLLAAAPGEARIGRGGRKAHQLDVKAQI